MHYDWHFGRTHCDSPRRLRHCPVVSSARAFLQLAVIASVQSCLQWYVHFRYFCECNNGICISTLGHRWLRGDVKTLPLRMSSQPTHRRTISRRPCLLMPRKCTINCAAGAFLALGVAVRNCVRVSTRVPNARVLYM